MPKKLPRETLYRIRDPKNFHAAMREDVELLRAHRAYMSLTTVIVCCLDALAAGSGGATRGKFEAFVTLYFPALCADLEGHCPGSKGAKTLYDAFRNGFSHTRGPKGKFAIAEDHEIDGAFAAEVEFNGDGSYVALNIDRLAQEFLMLLDQLEEDTA